MPKKDQGLVHAKRKQLEMAIQKHVEDDACENQNSDVSQADDNQEDTNAPDIADNGACQRAIPLRLRDTIVRIKHEETIIGTRSLEVLLRVPRFNGIRTRVPAFFVLDARTSNPIYITNHLNALTMFFHSIMARKILPVNVTLAASNKYYSCVH